MTSLPPAKNSVNILLVDDEVRNLDVLESILTSPVYHLVRVQTAQEALMALIDGEFAAIVLDIQMPGTNGIELANLIKQRKRTQHIPIIFLTAYFQEDKDILQGYEVGAVDYLTKPVDSKILKSKIAVFVELFQKNRELASLNRAMESEIARRISAEQGLRQFNHELEARVQERTAELSRASEAQELASRLPEENPAPVIRLSRGGIVHYANPAAQAILAQWQVAVGGQAPLEISQRTLSGDRKSVMEMTFEGRSYVVNIVPVSQAQYVNLYFSDITDRKCAELALERAHQEAIAASRAKDDFLAALSHELRTPLNPVLLLASEAAEDPALPPEVRAQFATIRNNVELEARLIDDLLDITRITHGKLALTMEEVDVHGMLKEAIATVWAELHQKGIALTVQLADSRPLVKGDAVRLQQVFWNVLKNAVKFTATGGQITVETHLPAGSRQLTVKIIDNGIGLTPEEMGQIFNAFAQGEHASREGSHRFGGLGLGLTISRRLVELHAGTISALSAGRGQGAAFLVELPLMAENKLTGHAPLPAPALNPSTSRVKKKLGLRILLVEDHDATRLALAHLLTRRDCQVMAATSVTEARLLAAGGSFDLVVSDIGLPDGNGFALMAELRDGFGLKGIALTGYGTEQDLVRSQAAGFIAHLVKPVRMESLEKALTEAMAAAEPTRCLPG